MNFLRSVLLISALLMFFAQSHANPLQVGDAAPTLTATTDEGTTLSLGDVYKKGYTLVYFYPKAGTSGCTAQGCSLRDAYEDLTKKGVTVIGVSSDTVADQKKFKEEQRFPFTLLADTDQKVIDAFGVPTRTVPIMGKLASRQAYLIDQQGKIVWADYKASTAQQAADVLAQLEKIRR